MMQRCFHEGHRWPCPLLSPGSLVAFKKFRLTSYSPDCNRRSSQGFQASRKSPETSLLSRARWMNILPTPSDVKVSRDFIQSSPSIMAGSKLVLEGRVSIRSFVLGLSVVLIPVIRTCFGHLDWVFDYLTETPGKVAICLHVAVVNGLLFVIYRGPLYKVAVRACFLGVTFGCGLIISCSDTTWTHFGWYMCSLSFFHYSEYLVTAIINPRSLSLDSFLLNHSVEYSLAALSSWLEFTVEKLLVPELKQLSCLSIVGLLMVLCGEGLRKAAMLTAGSNFNHIVQNEKAQSHVLVTGGVYAYFRHPSYVGWFYWSIGTQVMLCNPVCILGYTIASWRFFRERIEEEELSLIHFFAEDYVEYKKKVPTGLPFISGIRVN